MIKNIPSYLANHFLIAMPNLKDTMFKQSLVYIVSHNVDGAMGLIVNYQPNALHLGDILEQLKPDTLFPAASLMTPIYVGGPLEPERGFVLHPKGDSFEGTVELADLAITSSQDILLHIGEKALPKKNLIALGYAGWEAGQLEQELKDNTWLTCPYSDDLLFDTPIGERFPKALAHIGVNIVSLSMQVGHA